MPAYIAAPLLIIAAIAIGTLVSTIFFPDWDGKR